MFSFDRIKIQDPQNQMVDESIDNSAKIFEFKQKEVMFDMQPNRMVIIRDISELIQKEYARSIAKLTEIMVASTSHDMRTPLNTIINMHNMIELKVDDPVVLSWLKIARSSSNLLLFLVNDTLDYFQIKSGKFKIKNGPVNIKELVERCFDLIKIQMQQKNQEQILEIDSFFED